jgi:hypothetical protein
MQVKAFWQERRQRRLEIAARVSGRRCRLAGPKSRVWGIYINIYQDLTNSAAESPFFPIGWRKKSGGINIKTAKTPTLRDRPPIWTPRFPSLPGISGISAPPVLRRAAL